MSLIKKNGIDVFFFPKNVHFLTKEVKQIILVDFRISEKCVSV